MNVIDILPYITGAGGALFVLAFGQFLFITGVIVPRDTHRSIVADKDRQIDILSRALDRERDRNETVILAARTATTVLQALHSEVEKK